MRIGKNEKKILLTLLASEKPLTLLEVHDFTKVLKTMYSYPKPQMYQAQLTLFRKKLIVDGGDKGLYGARQMRLTELGREKAEELYERMISRIQDWIDILVILKNRKKEVTYVTD